MKLPKPLQMQVIAPTLIHTLQGESFLPTQESLTEGTIEVIAVDAELPMEAPPGPNTGCWAMFMKDGNECWCQLRDLLPEAGKKVKWLEVAHKEIGTGELGDQQFKYIDAVTAAKKKTIKKKRMLDWCACFIKWCVDKAQYTDAPDSTMAQAWKEWGKLRIGDGTLNGAKLGDIAVGRRGGATSEFGHVAIFIMADEKGNWMLLLGGNQDETPLAEGGTKRVRYAWYPRSWKAKNLHEVKDPKAAEGRLLTVRYQ